MEHKVNIAADNPLHNISNDRFDRGKIVQLIAKNIIEITQHTHLLGSFNIALYGRWGEGKTSLLNCIHTEIAKTQNTSDRPTSEDEIIQIRYNPWVCLGQEQMLKEFFQLFLNAIGKNEALKKVLCEYGNKLIGALKAPLTAVASAVNPVAGMATNAVLSLSCTALNNQEKDLTLHELYTRTNNLIRHSNQHFVIYVDDIDRLDKEEIHLVLRMIKQLAGFNNMIFIIAMDQGEVAKALNEYYPSAHDNLGGDFLEKIIQMPVHIPRIPRVRLREYVETCLFEGCLDKLSSSTTSSFDRLDVGETKESIMKHILPLIDSPRQIIQLVNNLWCTLPSLYISHEVNLDCFVCLSFLKIIHFSGYEVIRRNKSIIVGSESKLTLFMTLLSDDAKEQKEKENIAERVKLKEQILQHSSEHRNRGLNSLVTHILKYLFRPPNNYDVYLKNDITDEVSFDKYFAYDVPDDIVSEKIKHDILELFCTEDISDVTKLINQLIQIYSSEHIREVINDIFVVHSDNECFSLERQCNLLLAMTFIDEINCVQKQSINLVPVWVSLIDELFSTLNQNASSLEATRDTYVKIATQSDLVVATKILLKSNQLVIEDNKTNLDEAIVILISRLKNELDTLFFLYKEDLLELLSHWQRIDQKDCISFIQDSFYSDVDYILYSLHRDVYLWGINNGLFDPVKMLTTLSDDNAHSKRYNNKERSELMGALYDYIR